MEFLFRGFSRWWSSETVAMVTGGNKGIGLEIVRRLALEGLTVILTARDETRGLKATQSLHAQGLQNVVFHTLDIGDSESRAQFVEWIQKTYGGLDILVNNAAVFHNDNVYETAVETMKINYRGTVGLTEELLPLFKASQAGARIVTVSSWVGKLMVLNDEQVRKKLTDVTQFDQKYLDELEQKYLEACRAGNGEPNGYTNTAYRFSKVLINSYSRLLALRLANQPSGQQIYLRLVHPGFVRTDIHRKLMNMLDEEAYQKLVASGGFNHEELIGVEEGADTPVWLCLVPAGDQIPSGRLWFKREELSYT
ncbi:hypothetical protein KC19_9G166700 [Ceratodon purpureus]|uniref:Uncharacterized protein n=1 Tax=Ceratodon purpureus TaxID=3225 RepID=A0A8T0H0P5_CERPU|nr:hypothetical protein KC19_9G166700 [Ceratodon purpureus]